MQGSFKNDVIPFIESHYDSTVQTIEFINTIKTLNLNCSTKLSRLVADFCEFLYRIVIVQHTCMVNSNWIS